MPILPEKNIKERGFVIHLLLLVVTLVVISFFIYKAGSVNNSLREIFSGFNPPSTKAINSADTNYQMKVLVLKYFPLTADGQNIDINVTGDVGGSYSTVRQQTIDVTNNLASDLGKATKYLGYKDSTAQSALTYSISDTKEYTQGVPFDPTTRRPLYTQILTSNNICDYVDNKGVSEVWMWAYQGPNNPAFGGLPYLAISESKMSGPFGDISNSYRGDDMPHCVHTYRLYTYNYGRGTAEALESWGHQMEAEVSTIDNHLFRDLWQGPNYPQTLGVVGRCGSVHNPPNATGEYDRGNPNPWNSDCLDWNPDGQGALSQISCANWGCSPDPARSYMIWNWQNLPGRNNNKTYQGSKLRNFWDIHGNWDNVMATDRTLLLTPSPTPPPSVNITDTFNRVDSTSLGNTETGQSWINIANGSWGIASGSAYPVNGCAAPGYAVVDAGVSDLVMQVTAKVNGQDLRFPFRVQDASNMYWIEHRGGDYYDINKFQNGASTVLGQTPSGIAANGDVLRVSLSGSNINLYVNGVLRAWANDSSIAGTKFGIGDWCNSLIRFDDFSLLTLPSQSPSPTPIPTPSPSPTPIPDTTSPSVSITSPLNNSTVKSGSVVKITANATDNVGVTHVDFYVNGSILCSSTTNPYSCSWTVPKGKVKITTIMAQAFDKAGNTSSSKISVQIR